MMPSAIVLAAGLSRRMGSFKLVLPWQGGTVIHRVVTTLIEAGISDIVVVTGWRRDDVAQALAGTPVRLVPNPRYAEGEMLSSIQAGLAALSAPGACVEAALLCLGDQPQMQPTTVQAVCESGATHGWRRVIIPSYQMRAGHPVLLPQDLWPDVLASTEHLRAVLAGQRERLVYLPVDTASILADLDTPEDYQREMA